MNELQSEPQQLWVLWNERQINQLMLRFGRALDTHDWALYESCFLSEFEVDFTDLTGAAPTRVSASLWAEFARIVLEPLKVHHQYSNHVVSFDGRDKARSTLYHVSRHFRPTERGSSLNYQYGWYENEYKLEGEEWKISRLCHKFQWVDGNDALLTVAEPEAAAITAKIFGNR